MIKLHILGFLCIWLQISGYYFTLSVAISHIFQTNNTATQPAPMGRLGTGWMRRHELINSQARQPIANGTVGLIYIGDSIVQKFENAGKEVWNYYYEPRHALNLGISGDRTQHVLWRLENGNIEGINPKLAIVMIGQNNGPFNTGAEIASGVISIIDLLRSKLKNTKILLLAIFQRRSHPTPERAVLDEANNIISEKYATDSVVTYLDVNYLFLRPDGTIPAELMPDFEHPSALGFEKWAEAIEPTVARLLGDEQKTPMNGSAGIVTNMKTYDLARSKNIITQQKNYDTESFHVNSSLNSAFAKDDNVVNEEAEEIDAVEHHWFILTIVIAGFILFYTTVVRIICRK
jgi:lysophospholipase L1-like esterase